MPVLLLPRSRFYDPIIRRIRVNDGLSYRKSIYKHLRQALLLLLLMNDATKDVDRVWMYFCFGILKRVNEIKFFFKSTRRDPLLLLLGNKSCRSLPYDPHDRVSWIGYPIWILPRRTDDNASTISFWLTPQRLAVSFSHFLWQFTSHSVERKDLLARDFHLLSFFLPREIHSICQEILDHIFPPRHLITFHLEHLTWRDTHTEESQEADRTSETLNGQLKSPLPAHFPIPRPISSHFAFHYQKAAN